MEKKISVIVPAYNSSNTLEECLNAIFNSDYKNFEVILVSDNSTDNSVEIAKRYNCKILELKENMGPANARNLGVEASQGELLLFIDSDVIIKKDSLKFINNSFDNKDTNVVQGVYSHEPNYKSVFTQYQQSFYCHYTWNKSLDNVSTFTTSCCAIRKDIFEKSKKFNSKILQ